MNRVRLWKLEAKFQYPETVYDFEIGHVDGRELNAEKAYLYIHMVSNIYVRSLFIAYSNFEIQLHELITKFDVLQAIRKRESIL